MTTAIDIRREEGLLRIVHSGTLTLPELESVRARAGELLAENDIGRVLIDGRDADITALDSVDAYEFHATHTATLPGGRRVRMACVVAPSHLEQSLFAETVARNRGADMRVFVEAGEAQRWLAGVAEPLPRGED